MVLAQDDNDQTSELRHFEKGALLDFVIDVHLTFHSQGHYKDTDRLGCKQFFVLGIKYSEVVAGNPVDIFRRCKLIALA